VGGDVQAELGGCALAGNAGPGRMVRGQACAFGIAGDGAAFGIGQVGVEPALALCQGLRVRQHHLDTVKRRRRAKQVVAHQQAGLAHHMCSGDCRNRSSDRETTPSVEFSTGTTPNSAVPDAVARKTSSMLTQGTRSMLEPKNCRAACSLKVPAGPRKATRCGASSARQADMISRQMGGHAGALERPGVGALQPVDHLGLAVGPETPASLRRA
jgi:hypothetical protein